MLQRIISGQIEMVCLNGQASMEMTEILVAMAGKLTDEVAHLKSGNVERKKQISDLQGPTAGTTGPPSFGRSKE
jgi:hypothetical protein